MQLDRSCVSHGAKLSPQGGGPRVFEKSTGVPNSMRKMQFSQRPGTAAGKLPDQVPDEIKMERLATVHSIQDDITLQHHKNAEDSIEEVLIEGTRYGNGQPFGRTRTNKIVNLESSECIREGDLLKVRIIRGLKHSLLGGLIN